ncbi:4'-phosphopantetheinyl transferase superfamily protein [Cyanobium gracile UHCC 0139]|uniref:4'-phosphopantetheinyl transferase superfamily protein n=1 Tax=Cyanobium gracile UHCC 0139 TaxID=3110308 RepID=A0ABU5RUA6_9CYAN|nr:4'-phosphopantetheinyl transferase superfamily protein [Cyanobium gracile]MEA5391360.1 4'-phosphopantetheinyl transferase superfamily protein [Cyanobium gracile UHCC 0139]
MPKELLPRRWPSRTDPAPPPWPPAGPDGLPLLLLIDRRDPHVRALLTPLGELLDSGERQRLERLRGEGDGERFLLGRGALRLILGSWLGCDPADLVLGAGPHGKPELLGPPPSGRGGAEPTLRFNVSHSGDLILLGFHPRRPVGVDLEQRRPVPEWQGIARRCLPPGEWDAIATLPQEEREQAFLAAWCRLEARLKARGRGLFGPSPAPRDPEPKTWPLLLPEGYVGAAALA